MFGELAAFGPFFAVQVHGSGDLIAAPWQPMSGCAQAGGLSARVDATRAALAAGVQRQPGDIELRVAASIAHLGLVARIAAPAIAADVLGEQGISLRLHDLWWQDRLGGPYPLSVTAADPEDAGGSPVDGAVRELTEAMARDYPVNAHILWGNVASAANGAAGMIAANRPALADAAQVAADRMLADVRVEGGALRAGPGFRRRSCCLIYRIAPGADAFCGDCALGTQHT